MKVKMIPGVGQEGDRTTGISQVVVKYIEYLKKMGVEFVEDNADVVVGHAGVMGKKCDVSVLHGIYWTADYSASKAEFAVNAKIVDSMRSAKVITVPSDWVRKTVERDFRISPVVIHHGIEWDEWQEPVENSGYILWNKNRLDRICDPYAMQELAKLFPKETFVSTFAFEDRPDNIDVIGKQSFDSMKKIVKQANIYLSLVKETFGIGTLEAMASGVPVLGWDFGGNKDIVIHGVTGYLAEPYNYVDLANGLRYCLEHREILGENSRESAKKWTWEDKVKKLYEVLETASKGYERKVSVIVPTYNYADKLPRALESMCKQSLKPHEIIIVDDGSKDDPKSVADKFSKKYKDIEIKFIRQENSGVAVARNTGVKNSTGNYISCIDPDDAVEEYFLEVCVDALEKNRDKYIAYTALRWIKPDGSEGISSWPREYDFDKFLKKQNQVPTCNVARRTAWERLGGQRQRYAPIGAGSEDAEMWLRAGAYGMGGILATTKPMFIYSWMSGIVSGNKDYQEVDWLDLHPWTKDGIHPFPSCATPKNKISHPVTQYDQAVVSIIVPVSEAHISKVVDVLDSIESQSFRKWEVIVVDDSDSGIDDFVKNAYPFVTWEKTGGGRGTGVARNLGVKKCTTSLILFLDADDIFSNWESLGAMVSTYYNTGDVVYSDYTIKENCESKPVAEKIYGGRLIDYNEKKKLAFVDIKSLDYDCEKAQADLDYNWSIVSCLVPKYIHEEIGGFDESLSILEDVDYYKRIAFRGYCFTRIKKSLFVVDRTAVVNDGKTKYNIEKAWDGIKRKLERVEKMACNGCGQRSKISKELNDMYNSAYKRVISKSINKSYEDGDFIRCVYMSPKKGDHPLVGSATKINYGYRARGDKVIIHRDDLRASPNLFQPVGHFVATQDEEKPLPPPPSPIKESEKKMLEAITEEKLINFGVVRNTSGVLEELNKLGVSVIGEIPGLATEKLVSIKGVGEITALKLKNSAMEYTNG